jgi:hypothetical protein
MLQLGNVFQGKTCAHCRHAIESDPAWAHALWYHRACLDEGTRALQRAQALAVRFGFGAAASGGAEAPGGPPEPPRSSGQPQGGHAGSGPPASRSRP